MTADISSCTAADLSAHLRELGELLHACVHAGASIGFVLPFVARDSEAFWTDGVLPGVQAGTRLLLVARQAGHIVGAVQLDYDTMPNQRHRAEVRKLLVHPAFRRRGIARALMHEVESAAARLGRTLLTLDTRTGDDAEPLYASLGYQTAGVIPGYCRDTVEDRLDSTTVMYRTL
ncbi:GNAT family N-acetyltransferase [Paraburkholderia sp.]|uniref:GNAT family N-acetyltransferase n=1 Tax=Paraburkholderia sp. TaxID=1926495 RepID=UPI003D6F1D55